MKEEEEPGGGTNVRVLYLTEQLTLLIWGKWGGIRNAKGKVKPFQRERGGGSFHRTIENLPSIGKKTNDKGSHWWRKTFDRGAEPY